MKKNCILLILTVVLGAIELAAQSVPVGASAVSYSQIQQLDTWTDIFDEHPKFEKGASVLHLGIGVINDAHIKQFEHRTVLPAVSLFWEKSIGSNFGLGLLAAAQIRRVDDLNINYNYFGAAARIAYHLNASPKLDPYIGLSFGTRYMEARSGEKARSKFKITTIPVIGTRYYMGNRIGFFAEIGSDLLTYAKAGLLIKLK